MTSDPFEFGDDLGHAQTEAAPAPYFAGLNDMQRAAVEATDGPVLVLAGAGTGKTRVLTTRLAHILLTQRAWPGQILAVTFTNRAAREMRERVEAQIGRAIEGLWLGTFHALCARILRRHAELVGLKSNFTILDQDDQIRLVKQVMQAADIDDKRWPARALHGIIQRWKDRGLTPDKVSAGDAGDYAHGRAVEIYREYQARLATLNAADFGDLLLHCLTVFTENADVLAEFRRRFKYLLVDEYQDTNVAQYLWLRLLAQEHTNICCVGDDDQSIYSWRGAEIGNILKFEKDFPGATVIRLEQNYRSTSEILAAASGLIAHNEGRLGKTLWTADQGGDKIVIRGLWDGEEEARYVCDEIEAIQQKGGKLNDLAVLVRAGFQTREFEERLLTLGIPYRVVGGPRFYERLEIRDAIAYLRVIAQPDDSLAFERIANKPRRGLGDATLQTLHKLSRAQNVSLVEAARQLIESDELRPQARKALGALLGQFDRWRAQAADLPQAELAELVLDESGYTDMWQTDKSPEAPGRLENLKELIVAMEEFENLAGFLEHVSLVMEAVGQTGNDMASLMTLHSAKGLEFDTVFLPGWEEGLFPHQRALDEGGVAALEEERRLAYVGLTRARQRALVSFAANRRVHNQWQSAVPSRFVDELPRDNVEVTSDSGLYGATAGRGIHEHADVWGEQDAVFVRNSRAAAMRTGYARGGRPAVIDAPAERVAFVGAGDSTHRTGQRVFHQKFGYGRVVRVEGRKLEIDFEHSGLKKVMDDFVQPA